MRRKKHRALAKPTCVRTLYAEPTRAPGYPSLIELRSAWASRVAAPIAALGVASAALSGCAGLGFAGPAMTGFPKPDDVAPTADVRTPSDPAPENAGYVPPHHENLALGGAPPPPSTTPWIVFGSVLGLMVIGATVGVVVVANHD